MVNCKPILFILKTYTAKLPRSGRKKKNIKQRQPTSTTKKAHCATHSLSHSLAVSVSLWSLQNSYNLIKRLLHNFFESDFRFLVLCTSRRLNWMRFMLTHTHRGRARETRGQNEWLRTERMGKNIYISTTESERWTRGASKKISKLNYKILSGKLFGKTKFLARVSLWFDHYFFSTCVRLRQLMASSRFYSWRNRRDSWSHGMMNGERRWRHPDNNHHILNLLRQLRSDAGETK